MVRLQEEGTCRDGAARAVRRDLGPFFDAWGVPISPEARASATHLRRLMPRDWPGDLPE